MHGSKAPTGRRLHGQQRDDLEEVVLDHVAQTAGGFVKRAAALHAEILGEGDLDAGHVVAVPDRLEERIGEAEIEDIHDRLLPEEVIDAEDRVFRKHRVRDAVELPRRGQVASERLFDDDARMLGQVRGTEPFDHRLEERGRDGEIVRRAPSATQRLFDRRERARVIVVPAHVPESGQKMVEGTLVIDPARSLDAVRHAFAQTRQTPLREGDADDRGLQGTSFRHRIERREDHLVGEIARHTEEHQRVRTRSGHQAPSFFGGGLFFVASEFPTQGGQQIVDEN